MEPTRTRTERDRAAAEARSRPSTQFASQYPSYPEQAQQLRRPPQQAPARSQFTDVLDRPAPRQEPQRVTTPAAPLRRPEPARSGTTALRRGLGVVAFAVLTGISVPLHILAIFFMYVQIESPADIASTVPLLAGMFAAVFGVLFVVGFATQLIGGFPGRWRARVVFALLSGVIALSIAYVAAITQF